MSIQGFSPDWTVPPGEILREDMQNRGLTPDTLARKAGLSVQAVNGILAGTGEITTNVAIGLELALGVSRRSWEALERLHQTDLQRLGITREEAARRWHQD